MAAVGIGEPREGSAGGGAQGPALQHRQVGPSALLDAPTCRALAVSWEAVPPEPTQSTPCAPCIRVEPASARSAPLQPVRTEDRTHLMFPGSRAKNTLVRVASHFVHVPRARFQW